ncbi:MAG TPA: nitroreductase family protein [Salinibacter sp.]|nr:nitroreductase family protein [Salinibacter sp.]
MSGSYDPIPLDFSEYPPEQMRERAAQFYERMAQRRSVRDFSDRPVPRELIKDAIRTAGTAPSGANQQPWQFVAVDDPDLKQEIREAVEDEEKKTYEERMPDEWREALAPLGTDWQKPYLTTAPWIVVCFAEPYGIDDDGEKRTHYYVQESVGIACGLFITALHHMGLATLTHTPAPMGFLRNILDRPDHERPYILFPVGYPADGATVPDVDKKPLDEIVQWNR